MSGLGVRFDHFSFQLASYYKYKTKPLLSSRFVFSTCGKFRNVDCHTLFLFHRNDNDKIQTEKKFELAWWYCQCLKLIAHRNDVIIIMRSSVSRSLSAWIFVRYCNNEYIQIQPSETFWSIKYERCLCIELPMTNCPMEPSQHWWGCLLLFNILYTTVRDCYRSRRITLIMGLSSVCIDLPSGINMQWLHKLQLGRFAYGYLSTIV